MGASAHGHVVQGSDRSFDVYVEVRYDTATPSTTCAPWTITVTGAAQTNNRCGSVTPGG